MNSKPLLGLLAVTLLFPTSAFAHEMTMREGKRAAKTELKDEVRYWNSKHERVARSAIRACEYSSDHVILCDYRLAFYDGDVCNGVYTIRYSSSTKRRIRVYTTYFGC